MLTLYTLKLLEGQPNLRYTRIKSIGSVRMNENQRFSIGEIAKLFDISASTIRYWEEEGLLSTKRNDMNGYREFDMESIIELTDIIFYRNLNVPIKKMKEFTQLSPENLYGTLDETETKVNKEISMLQAKLKVIKSRKKQINNVFSLRENPYQQEFIDIEKIVAFEMDNPKDIQVQLEDPNNFVLFKNDPKDKEFQMGLAVPYNYENQNLELWRQTDHPNAMYITCLLDVQYEDKDKHNFKKHERVLKTMGYKLERIIAPYLASITGLHDVSTDFYKAWLEVTSLE